MRHLIERVKETVRSYSMLHPKDTVLIALSGGPDSVCLLHILTELKEDLSLKLYATYIDHGLRPTETPEEIEFCKNLCKGLSVYLTVRSVDVKSYALKKGLSKQESARELRYKALKEVAEELKADKIALGHHANDQVETFFINLLRGTGPKGLSGIPPIRGNIIRPLIEIKRSEIESYLEEKGLNYIVDSSNLKKDYLRNWLRLTLIPELKKVNPSLIETMTRMFRILREEEAYFDIIVTKTLMRLITRKREGYIELFLSPLDVIDKVILRRVLRRVIDDVMGLKRVGFIHIDDIIELIKDGKSGDRLYLPENLRVIKGYSTLIITKELPIRIGRYDLTAPGEVFIKETGTRLRAEFLEKIDDLGNGRDVLVLDADKTGLKLQIRSREAGDFFYPLGFGKRKKLQDFFVNEKVPRDERDSIPIITVGNDIIWIAGYRGDERFKVTKDTRRFLRLEIERSN